MQQSRHSCLVLVVRREHVKEDQPWGRMLPSSDSNLEHLILALEDYIIIRKKLTSEEEIFLFLLKRPFVVLSISSHADLHRQEMHLLAEVTMEQRGNYGSNSQSLMK